MRKTSIFYTLVALFAISMATISSAQAARMCKDGHYHYGSGDAQKNMARAKASAAQSWSSFTVWEYGAGYGRISSALDRKYSCEKTVEGVKCSVYAIPCRTIGRHVSKPRYKKRRRKIVRRFKRNRKAVKRYKGKRRIVRRIKRKRRRSRR